MEIGLKIWPKRLEYKDLNSLLSGFDYTETPLDELETKYICQTSVLHFPHKYSHISANISNPKDKENVRYWFKKLLSTGINECVVHPDPAECERSIAIRTLKDNLQYFLEHSKIIFFVENMPGKNYLCYEAKEIRDIVSMNERLSVCVDTEHLYQATGGNKKLMEKFIKSLSDKITYVHACDTAKNKGHLPIGNGDIDFRHLISKLKATECKRITLEVFSCDPNILLMSKNKIANMAAD